MTESSLHAALKELYTQAGDQQEVLVDGYEIDVVKNGKLVEIQTRQFHHLKPKLLALLENHPLLLVHPIPEQKWIRRVYADGNAVGKPRKSPKRGRPEQIFSELVRFPQLVNHPNLAIEVVMIHEEDTWRDDGQGSWRRKGWSLVDRQLIQIIKRLNFSKPEDFLAFLPAQIAIPFTNQELADRTRLPLRLAQQMTYCLKAMDMIEEVGRKQRAKLYVPRRPS